MGHFIEKICEKGVKVHFGPIIFSNNVNTVIMAVGIDPEQQVGWALSLSEDHSVRGDVAAQNPCSGPLGRRNHVRGVIPPRTFQSPRQ